MKLNLLPAGAKKGSGNKLAWFLAPLFLLLCTLAGIFLQLSSASAFTSAKEAAEEVAPRAAKAVSTAAQADVVIQQAAGIIRNTNLAQDMVQHNAAYPRFYDQLLTYVPSFYRLTSVTATPVDANTAQVTLEGTIRSYQQYADLPLALMRIPGAQGIQRSGFQRNLPYTPGLTEQDRLGIQRLQDDPPIPQDPLERLAYLENLPKPSGYLNVGNFGSEGNAVRTTMPGESLVRMTMTILSNDRFKFNLQTPNPRATLSAAPAAPAAGPGPGPGAGPAAGPPAGVGAPPRGGAPVGAGGREEDDN
jgi:hypothetical protein